MSKRKLSEKELLDELAKFDEEVGLFGDKDGTTKADESLLRVSKKQKQTSINSSTAQSTSSSANSSNIIKAAPQQYVPQTDALAKEIIDQQLKQKEENEKQLKLQQESLSKSAHTMKQMTHRSIAGETWVDNTLAEWPQNDFRLFVGNLSNDVTDDILSKAFSHFSSFAKAKIIRDKKSKRSKGFGFVSFLNADDYLKAFDTMQRAYIGSRPCLLKKSSWKDRSAYKQ